MEKPFAFGILADEDYFINREKESNRIVSSFRMGVNTILISPRRWGKSSLVAKAATRAKSEEPKLCFAFVVLFSIRTEEEFYNLFATSLIKAAASKFEERIALAGKILKSIIPKLNMNLDPTAEFSLGVDWDEAKKKPSEILDLAENLSKERNIKMVICIDEFQNICHFEYPTAFQKKLRSFWQKHQTASYCLYGSKRQVMLDMFENRNTAFYKFGDLMFLEKIATPYWVDYIQKRFKETEKSISAMQAEAIASVMENHPYFVQQLAMEVWYYADPVCRDEHIDLAINDLAIKSNILYQREIEHLTSTQIGFLKAVLNGEEQFTSMEILTKYKLGTSANIKRIKEALINKELIDYNGKKMEILDPLFKIWIKKYIR